MYFSGLLQAKIQNIVFLKNLQSRFWYSSCFIGHILPIDTK